MKLPTVLPGWIEEQPASARRVWALGDLGDGIHRVPSLFHGK